MLGVDKIERRAVVRGGDQRLGQVRPQAFVAKIVLNNGDTRRGVADAQRRDAQGVVGRDAAHATAGDDGGHVVAPRQESASEGVTTPRGAALAVGRENVAREKNPHWRSIAQETGLNG